MIFIIGSERRADIVTATHALNVQHLLERLAAEGHGDEIVSRADDERPRSAAEAREATASASRRLDADQREYLEYGRTRRPTATAASESAAASRLCRTRAEGVPLHERAFARRPCAATATATAATASTELRPTGGRVEK